MPVVAIGIVTAMVVGGRCYNNGGCAVVVVVVDDGKELIYYFKNKVSLQTSLEKNSSNFSYISFLL